MKRVIFATIVPLLLTGYVTRRDLRTQTELARDADNWARANSVRVAMSPDQLKDCSPLGVVSERSYDSLPGDPAKRPMDTAWPGNFLRFRMARVGVSAALICVPIKK